MTVNNIFIEGKDLFLRYFYNPHVPVFKGSALPGKKRGVSGTIVIPNNFAINKYIEEQKKFAAIEFMKYISLKETQKEYIIKNSMISGIMELYNDTEVCNMMECDIIKDAYPFSFMSNDINLFADDNYHIKYRSILFEYLYNNKPIMEVLKKVEDITKIYTFSLKTDDSSAGLIIFIILLTFSIGVILSLIFIFIKKLENRFKFLSKDLWFITVLGFLILMSSIITLYGDVTNVNCHLKISLINLGFILSISPSLLKLITNFPERNKISIWFEKNKYIFILIILIFTLCLNGIFTIPSYTIHSLTTSDGKNYKKCVMSNTFGNIIYYLIHFYHIFIIFVVLCFIYIEWSLKETILDVNFLATALFMDILSIIILIIIDKIAFKNFIIYNILLSIDILIFAASNYLFIYFIRILPMFENVKNVCSKHFLKEVLNTDLNDSKDLSNLSSLFHNALNNTSTGYSTTTRRTSTNNSKLTEITRKIMNYHNQTIIIDSTNTSNISNNI